MPVRALARLGDALSALGTPQGNRSDLAGSIASAAFTSGHRFVVGLWHDSPLGPISDVMWAKPDGERLLLVERSQVGEFISAVYRFDRVEQVSLECRWDGSDLRVDAGDLVLTMRVGRAWPIPMSRLRALSAARWIEAPVARRLLGVRSFGISPTGVFEWYRADQYRAVVEGRASLAGTDLGSLSRFSRPTGFGFSEPPRRPSVVRVRPLLIDPTGRLEKVSGSPDRAARRTG
ncbi:MAG: hypothetical protein M3011_09245 [Actinomycetota bacterium]|nr:hypothetical protein [Actinomycetota bacterium]